MLGLPPAKVQEYPVTVPSGSLPVPAKDTDCPALMVTLVEGLVMVPVGGMSEGVRVSSTNLATEGTPAEFKIKSR